MKTKFIYLVVLLVAFVPVSFAQDFSGKAFYQSKTNMSGLNLESKDLTPEMSKMIEEKLNNAMEKTYILSFSKDKSIFEEEKKLASGNSSGMKIMTMGSGSGKIYKDLKTKTSLSEDEILDKEFLVSSDLENYDWQIKNETKKIGEYLCQKAVCIIPATEKEKKDYEDFKNKSESSGTTFIQVSEPKDKTITVWFATEIPVSNGPNEFWGLPGLILEANYDKTTILCTKIVLNPKDKIEIKEPKNGKKITKPEFDALMEKQMEGFKTGNGTFEINIGN